MKKRTKTSQYYGVCKISSPSGGKQNIDNILKKPWQAMIKVNGKSTKLGMFQTERAAAVAVDKRLIDIGKVDKLNILKLKK